MSFEPLQRCRRHTRSLGLAITVLTAWLAASSAAAKEVRWYLDTTGRDPQWPGSFAAACGRLGTYHFAIDTGGPAPWPGAAEGKLNGQEEPPGYARPTATGELPEPAAAFAWLPAAERPICLGDGGRCDGSRPWLAVLDWGNEHGRSVGRLAWEIANPPEAAAAVDVLLFPLDRTRRELAIYSQRGATDFHVLNRLCQLAAAVDAKRLPPPLALNLSFGRAALPGDPAESGGCPGQSLGCQIHQVLAHLAARPADGGAGVMVVAAAGNHRRLLFPASLPQVVATGMLDSTALGASAGVVPAWETPSSRSKAAWSLMPGAGLCLPQGVDGQGSEPEPLPAGSSYAASLLTGWLAGPLLAREPLEPGSYFWPELRWQGSRPTAVLVAGSARLESMNSRVNDQLAAVFAGCGWQPAGALESNEGRLATGLLGAILDPTSRLPSPVDLAAAPSEGPTQPTPDSNPCVPCVSVLKPPPNGLLARLGTGTGTSDGQPPAAGTTLEVAAWASRPFGAGVRVLGLYLRSGNHFQPLALTASELDALTEGNVKRLEIQLDALAAAPSGQLSLVYLLRSSDRRAEKFWTSVPILPLP